MAKRSDQLSVRFWGVRGSIATPGDAFVDVGGNTTCVEIRAGDELIILDAGTGLRPLGQSLRQPLRASFLITHFHWDHIQGLPLFWPAHQQGNRFTFFAPGEHDADVRAVFAQQMQPPNFPVSLDALAARLDFRALRGGEEFEIGSARVRSIHLNHPQGCLGYRITAGGASVVFATDNEPCESGPFDRDLVDFARGADLLIHDGQYTEDEYNGHCGPIRKGWGHSTFNAACAIARQAGVKQLALFHHDPSHDDDFVERMANAARKLFSNTIIAREGLRLKLAGQRAEQHAADWLMRLRKVRSSVRRAA